MFMAFTLADVAAQYSQAFESIAKSAGFDVIYSAADRYGVLEWRAALRKDSRSTDVLNRYITLALVVRGPAESPVSCEITTGVEIDDERGFGKRPCRTWVEMASVDPEIQLRQELSQWIDAAMQMSVDNLTDLYLFPRRAVT
jgi:hypothetical protein